MFVLKCAFDLAICTTIPKENMQIDGLSSKL